MKTRSDIIHIVGLVTVSEWDNRGNPFRLSLACSGEKDFSIGGSNLTEELFYLTGEYVEISGQFQNLEDGTCLLIPDKYRLAEVEEETLDFNTRRLLEMIVNHVKRRSSKRARRCKFA